KLASLGDRLWYDTDQDGQQDAGEAGVAGQSVKLIGGGVDKIIGTADDTAAFTVTDLNGLYHFTALTPGVQYQVQFTAPVGTVFTTQDSGPDASDSDANTVTG